jgi:hypothetical protein
LFGLNGGQTEVWSRYLINNDAPVRVFVADSGKYVVTVDEWHHVGELPVVIYGWRGELIRVHSIDSLGLKEDDAHIGSTVSSYWWDEDSISFFDSDDEIFFIRLHWGKWIMLKLRNGNLLEKERMVSSVDQQAQYEQKWKDLEEYRTKTLATRAIQMLGSKDAHERKTGALVCGQQRLTDAVPQLRALLKDKEFYTSTVYSTTKGDYLESTIVLYVRKAAKEALALLGDDVGEVICELPEKNYLRYDEAARRYIVDLPGEE